MSSSSTSPRLSECFGTVFCCPTTYPRSLPVGMFPQFLFAILAAADLLTRVESQSLGLSNDGVNTVLTTPGGLSGSFIVNGVNVVHVLQNLMV